MLLRPNLKRKAEDGRTERGDQDGEDQASGPSPMRHLPMQRSENRDGKRRQQGGRSHLDESKFADRVVFNVTSHEDDMQRKHYGGEKHQGVATVEAAKALPRNGQQIEPRQRGDCRGPDPGANSVQAERGKDNGNDDDARACAESSLRRSRELQSGGLKSVASKQEKTDLSASPHCPEACVV